MRLEREDAKGRCEFWEAKVKKQAVEIRTGIKHFSHKTRTKSFASAKAAKAGLDKLVAAPRKAGFSEPVPLGGQILTAPIPTNPKLEAALRASDDAGAFAVYADWLQAQGSRAGELMVLAAALEARRDARKQRRLEELAKELGLPDDKFATWGWRDGTWRWLRLENTKDWMDPEFDAAALASRIFATPFCARLEELRIGLQRWEYCAEDAPAVLRAAGAFAWARSLARLHVGDVPNNVDMAHHRIGDVGKLIAKTFPALSYLRLHSGDWGAESFVVSGLDLPRVTELVVETCAMSRRRLRDLLAAKLPKLERLELWFGSTDYGADATAKDLAPLLDGKLFGKLRHLGLRNAEFTSDLAARLPRSPIARRLESLDLLIGTLDDTGARELAAGAPQLGTLRSLCVDDNFLSPAGLAALERAFGKDRVTSTKQKPIDANEPGWRYVSVSE